MKTMRAFALLGGLATATFAGGQAQAASCVSDPNFQGALVSTALGAGTCTLMGGQVTFDLTTNNLPVGATAALSFSESTSGFSVNIFPNGFIGLASGTGNVTYTLASLTGPLSGVRLDSTTNNGSPATIVTKRILETGTSLASTNGSVADASLTSQVLLTVTDAFTVTNSTGTLFSFTNEFFVPEPMTLGMFGVGLAGLGWARRRRAVA